MPINVEGRGYFKRLGRRIAQWRRVQGLTQTELADILDVSQQTVFAYEAGERRISLSLLPTLAKTLGVSIEQLVDETRNATTQPQHPSPALLRQAELLQQLPKEHQRVMAWLIKALLTDYNSR